MSPTKITALFPVWAIIMALIAYSIPSTFSAFKSWIVPLLSLVMFGMGMTLTWEHFTHVLKRPGIVGIAVSTQFLFMPFAAFWISDMLALSRAQTIGMLLVGTSAGGTASNVICYLARGNLALSVLLTSVSTLIAVFATPAISYFYLHETIPVPVWKMIVSIAQIVLLPVFAGTLVNRYFSRTIIPIQAIFPLISTLSIIFIIAIIVAINADSLATAGPLILFAVILHNSSGLMAGYLVSKCFGYNEQTCRTVSIEVGMQNSGLSVALAMNYFSSLAALPGAVFSIWHNISGALLASFWGKSKNDV